MGYTFTRKDLYENVWSEPLKTLASKYGISDVALGKACRKAGIPRPERGYWAKKKAGKPTRKAVLQERFPGLSDTIEIGRRSNTAWRSEILDNQVPQPPEFSESLDALYNRIRKMVGKVAFPQTTNKTHIIIKKLLEQDDERRKEYEKHRYSWYEPRFDSRIERRRLRILNAIFLATQRLGCRPNMSTSKYDYENRDASILVGNQHISITLKSILNKKRNRTKKDKASETLCLTIKRFSGKSSERSLWEEVGGVRLEKQLNDIVVEILMAGEIQYRELTQHQYEWMLQRLADLQEEERQKIIEEERKERELREQQEKERIERLLAEASALQQAETIRNYVSVIQSNAGNIDAPLKEIERWASWALKQADRIDPIKNLSFLNYEDFYSVEAYV